MKIFPTCLESAYGRIDIDQPCYQALDTVTVRVQAPDGSASTCEVWVCDPNQQPYHRVTLTLRDGQAEHQFRAAGLLGVQYLYVLFPGETRNQGRWSRYTNFEVAAQAAIHTGDADFDDLLPFTEARMRLGRRAYQTPAGRMVGYISGDTWHFDGLWLRDWVHQMSATRLWDADLQCGLDRFLEQQRADGMVPDGIERSGRTWRVGLESDVEYILTLGVYLAWQATGDDDWLRATLPRLEQAMAYIQSDPKHWDPKHGLIKRQHSCDTWDYDIDGATDHGEGRHVLATCDQSGYALAFRLLSSLYAHLGDETRAEAWQMRAEAYRRQANQLLWDGVKYQHHLHLDAIDHADFDESQQLAMGNTWAITRGLADPDQARSIIDEYRRRHAATGDAYPWWSLQPGYPNHLGYWKDDFRQQGAYANGGLMPWVGAELCRAALQNGREAYGVELLRAWADHLRRTGGGHVWYWPDGQAGFRTTNEVNYTGWGMSEWVTALFEGLAGVRDTASLYQQVHVSPRWAAADVRNARVCARYAASDGYFAYQTTRSDRLTITFTGSGEQVQFNILLPADFAASVSPTISATLEGQPVEVRVVEEDGQRYARLTAPIQGAQTLVIG